ncbi:MAG: hypothetical protein ACRBCS_15735 [Cellvibrionaceae bacterium]
MPYVNRGDDGKIVAVSDQVIAGCTESIDNTDAELNEFISEVASEKLTVDSARFFQSDMEFIRVMEDLINVLIDKHIICFTDLPDMAQQKVSHRKSIRAALSEQIDLLDDDDTFMI